MKQFISLVFIISLSICACASPVVSPSAPENQVDATSTVRSAEALNVENTATAAFIAESSLTPTPVPPSPHWYWSVEDSDTAKVIAVNQFGERRELGALDGVDDMHTQAVSIDSERALLFLDSNDILRIYLLTPDGMQKIKLPSEPFYFNTDFAQISRTIVAVYEDRIAFSYKTNEGSNVEPVMGSLLLIDLTALTTTLIDEKVNRDTPRYNRNWFHISQDGRYLRYQNGDKQKIAIRELDMVTGIARTLFTASGSPFTIKASPWGDLWYLGSDSLILDLNGNQTNFTDEVLTARPLKDGTALIFSLDCADDCPIKVISPFGDRTELVYDFPWPIEAYFGGVSQLLPDQSLLFVGEAYAYLSNRPASLDAYPHLLAKDRPLFRLTPDGQARLVGIYPEEIYNANFSDDGRYILLRAPDQSSFFMYDAIADRPLFEIPIDTALEDYSITARFFDTGILAGLSASVPGGQGMYRFFQHVHVYKTSTSIAWEDVLAEIAACPDLLNDGTLVCWFYRPDSTNFDLIRLDPANGTKKILAENAWLIEFTP